MTTQKFDPSNPELQESSASPHLKSLKYKGKSIDSVWREGEGAKRVLVFADGTVERTNKQGVATLSRIKGTLDQLAKYKAASPTERKRMLDRSREIQQSTQKNAVGKLVDSILRARTGKGRKKIHGQIKQALQHPAESPLTGHPSVMDTLYGKGRHAKMVRQIDGIESVQWITVHRGNRLIHVPVRGKHR